MCHFSAVFHTEEVGFRKKGCTCWAKLRRRRWDFLFACFKLAPLIKTRHVHRTRMILKTIVSFVIAAPFLWSLYVYHKIHWFCRPPWKGNPNYEQQVCFTMMLDATLTMLLVGDPQMEGDWHAQRKGLLHGTTIFSIPWILSQAYWTWLSMTITFVTCFGQD